MTTLAFPTLSMPPARIDWRLIASTQVHEAPGTGAMQTQELPGALWACTITFESLGVADARILQALLASLRGRAGRIAVPNFAQPAPRGVGGGTPLVKGAAQTGVSIIVDGAPLSTSSWLRIGDFVGIAGGLFMVTADVNTNGAGEATLPVAPPVLVAPADNAPVTLALPTVVMRLVDDQQGWTYTGAPLIDFTLDLIEVPT